MLLVLVEEEDHSPINEGSTAEYVEELSLSGFPVLGNPAKDVLMKIPFEGTFPTMCVLTPAMEMLDCYEGESGTEEEDELAALDLIVAHANSELR